MKVFRVFRIQYADWMKEWNTLQIHLVISVAWLLGLQMELNFWLVLLHKIYVLSLDVPKNLLKMDLSPPTEL